MEEAATNSVDWWARSAAIVGISLSILALAWNVFDTVWRDRARLKVMVEFGRLAREQTHNLAAMSTTVTGWLDCVTVSVSNVGRRPMTIRQCILENADGSKGIFSPGAVLRYGPRVGAVIDESHKMPKRLEEGEGHTYYFPLDSMRLPADDEQSPLPTGVIVRDGTGKDWRASLPDGIFVTPQEPTGEDEQRS